MPDRQPQLHQLDPRLRNVLQKLAANLSELTALLESSTDQPQQECPVAKTENDRDDKSEGQSAPAGQGSISGSRATNPNEPTVEELFRQRAPTADRLSQLILPWDMLLRSSVLPHATEWFGFYANGCQRSVSLPSSHPLAAGFGAWSGDKNPTFIWNDHKPKTLVGVAMYGPSDGRSRFIVSSMAKTWSSSEESFSEIPAHGKLWMVDMSRLLEHLPISEWRLDLSTIAFLTNLLQLGGRTPGRHMTFETSSLRIQHEFIGIFAEHEQTRLGLCHLHLAQYAALPRHDVASEPSTLFLQFHARSLSRSSDVLSENPTKKADYDGLCLERTFARFDETNAAYYHRLTERVVSICLKLTLTKDAPYNIVVLMDRAPWQPDEEFSSYIDSEMTWAAKPNRLSCGRGTGIVQFFNVASLIIENWESCWTSALDEIDKAVSVNLTDSAYEEKWRKYMFDDSFHRSRVYFTVLEILRTSGGWLEDSLRDWEGLVVAMKSQAGFRKLFSSQEVEGIDECLGDFTEALQSRAEPLKARIRRKMEEVKSLQDGIFNATSLREATKGIELNRAVYTFTIITVIYTPISFVATFWALPFLNSPGDDGKVIVPSGFIISFVIIPILTYTASLVFAWYVHVVKSREKAKEKALKWFYYFWDYFDSLFSWRLRFIVRRWTSRWRD